jgi:hypothetical protein
VARGSSFSITLKGLSEAGKIPGWIDIAQRAMLEQIAEELAEAIGEASGSKTIAASFRGRALSSTKALVESRGTAFAKARDRGAYITPKGGKVLRFADGSFRRVARLTPHNYVKRGMRQRRKIGDAAFARHFGDLKSGGA